MHVRCHFQPSVFPGGDPVAMLNLSAEEIQYRIFTAKADLPEGIERIPLKTIHINKCPIVAQAKVLRAIDAERLGIDIELCHRHKDLIQQSDDLQNCCQRLLSWLFNVSG
jgi:exodeoxyribonuclease-1